MCRNIRTLFNFEPPATEDEVRAASLQFVRKVSGFRSPSRANEEAFNLAVEETFAIIQRLIAALTTQAPSRNREVEAEVCGKNVWLSLPVPVYQQAKKAPSARFGRLKAPTGRRGPDHSASLARYQKPGDDGLPELG